MRALHRGRAGLVLQGCNHSSMVLGMLLGCWNLAVLGPETWECWRGCMGAVGNKAVGEGQAHHTASDMRQGRVDTASLMSMIDESPWKHLFSL